MVPFLHRATSGIVDENPLWLIVLCDIMTNLMLFFLILYAFTRQPANMRKQFAEGLLSSLDAPQFRQERIGDLVRQFHETEASRALPELFRKAGLEETTEVELSESHIRVRLATPVLFISGRATLTPIARKALEPVGSLLASFPNPVMIEGHTDDSPITSGDFSTNWELSVARAYSVMDYLSKTAAIAPERFVIAGYGEFKPISENITRQGRARNRRIEIAVLRRSAQ